MSDNPMDADADIERSLLRVRAPAFTQLDSTLALEESGYRPHTDACGPTWDLEDLSRSNMNHPTRSPMVNDLMDHSNIQGPTCGNTCRCHMDTNNPSLLMRPAEEDVWLYNHNVPHRPTTVNNRAKQTQSMEADETHLFTPAEPSFPPPFYPFKEPSDVSIMGAGAWSQGYDYTVGDPAGGTEDVEWYRSCRYFQSESEPDILEPAQLDGHPYVQNTLDEGTDPLSNIDVFRSVPVSDAGIIEIPDPAGGNTRYFSRRDSNPWSAVRAASRSVTQAPGAD